MPPCRRVADVAQWIRDTLGYTPCAWLLLLEFRLGHEPLLKFDSLPVLDLGAQRVRYGIFTDQLERWLMVEGCRFVLWLWGRATDDATAQALAAHVSGRASHLRVVPAPHRATQAVGAPGLARVPPRRPTAPEAAPSAVRVLGLHRQHPRPPA